MLPRVGVRDDVGDMALVGPGRVDGAGCIEIDVTGRAKRIIRAKDGLEGRLPVRGIVRASDDGFVDAVRRVVGELDEKQKLREGAVLAMDAPSKPLLRDGEHLGKEPRLNLVIEAMLLRSVGVSLSVLAEVFLQGELREKEGNLVLSSALEVVQGVDAALADDRGVFRFGRDVRRRE